MGRTVRELDFKIDFNTINNLTNCVPVYHAEEDTFFLRPQEPSLATSFDWDGDVWLRVDPETGEIVGIEIDDFESVFLKKYPQLEKAWKETKPLCHRKKKNKSEETCWEGFLRIILEFLRTLVRERPQQAQLNIL